MKTNFTRKPCAIVLLYTLLFFSSPVVQAQPEYIMSSPSYISGTPLGVNSVYRFYNVKPGVDAVVTILSMTGGATVTNLDAGSGYDEAFQPDIAIPANSSGYVEFRFRFVTSNTNTTNQQALVNVTSIDVDGNSNFDGLGNGLHEFDEINMGTGAFYAMQLSGSELSVSQSGNWIKGTNIGGVEYPGRDTTAKSAMFTVTSYNIGSFTARIGVTNNAGFSTNRQRSIYFKSFVYNQIPLAASCLRSFSGNRSNSKTELNWALQQCHLLDKLQLERSYNGNNFLPVGEIWVDKNQFAVTGRFNDAAATAPILYYRLKIVYASGRTEYSNVLVFRSSEARSSLRVYPTLVQSQATLSFDAVAAQNAVLRITDYSGRTILQRSIRLQQGNNQLMFELPGTLTAGQYLVTLHADGRSETQRIIKQ